jgi:hypothetical protein
VEASEIGRIIGDILSHLTAVETCSNGEIVKDLRRDLSNIERRRDDWVREYQRRRDQPPVELLCDLARRKIDPVSAMMVCIIVSYIDPAAGESLADIAWEELVRRREAYPAVKDLLPPSLRDRAERYQAWHRYRSCTNPTALADWAEYRRQLADRPPAGRRIPTGLASLDAAIGGLPQVTFLAGPAGVGKSDLSLTILCNALRDDPDLMAIFYSLDMPKSEIYGRLLAREAGVSTTDIAPTSGEPPQVVAEAEARLKADILPRLLVFEGTKATLFDEKTWQKGPLTAKRMLALRQALQKSCGARRCLDVVDLLQRMDAPRAGLELADGERAAQPHGATELEADVDRLELLREYRECTVSANSPEGDSMLVISQTRKADSRRQSLTLEDVKGNAQIGFDGYCVLLLEPDQDGVGRTADTEPLVLTVAKVRDGRKGPLRLLFDHQVHRFRCATDSSSMSTPIAVPGSRGRDPLAGLS